MKQTAATQNRQVRQVVSDVGDAAGEGVVAGEKVFESGPLVLDARHHRIEAELGGATLERRGVPSRQQSDADARALGQLECQAVADVEAKQGVSAAVVVEATVGEHAVDVAEQPVQLDGVTGQLRIARDRHHRLRRARLPTGRGGGGDLPAAHRSRTRRAR